MAQNTPNPNATSQPDSVEQEMVRLISNQARRVPLPVFIALIIMSWIALKPLPAWLVGIWFVIATAVMVSRYLTLKALPDAHELTPQQRLQKFVRLNLISGLTHTVALGAFPFFSEAERAFFSVLLMGLCTGSVATCAGYRPALLAYVSPIMLGLSLMWALGPGLAQVDVVERVIGVLLLFYAAVLLGLARELNRGIVDAWDIRVRERELNVQLQKALESAENASRAKTRFLAAASHDLRQPLHTISMLGAALGLRPADKRSKEIVSLLNDVTQSFSEQLDGLLDISKLDAGVITVDRRSVKASELLAQHAAEVQGLAAAKGIKLNLVSTTDAYVDTDAALLTRILRNLTQNAIKFTNIGSITLQANVVGKHVELSVSDTGHGIALDQQEKVFQEFYQIGNPERDREQGLGLGLSIVRRLVDLLGISIRMQSVPDEGTTFILELPLADASSATQPLPVANESTAAFDLCVLVVDDEKNVRTSLRMLLEELGCTCLEAHGTDQAIEHVALVRPDLVLADFRLRGTDSGLLAIAAVQKRWPGVPAVLVSGDTAPDRLQEAQHAGIALRHKPLPLDVLKQELAKVQPQL
jgi:signal transduction histidine kinase/CheY-like chemotaxis protein